MTVDRYFECPDSSPRAQDRRRGIFPPIIPLERRKLLQRLKDNGDSEIGTASRQDNRRRKLLCRREATHAQEHMILPLYYTEIYIKIHKERIRNIFSIRESSSTVFHIGIYKIDEIYKRTTR